MRKYKFVINYSSCYLKSVLEFFFAFEDLLVIQIKIIAYEGYQLIISISKGIGIFLNFPASRAAQ